MSDNSKIEWTDATWNILAGCEAISPGCAHCYAATMTRRLEAMGQADYSGLTTAKHFNGTVRTLPHKLAIALRRKKPTRYFVNSMSDLFHKGVPDEFIAAVFGVMAACPQHTFQILTKRAERLATWCLTIESLGGIGKYIRSELGRSAIRGLFDAVAKSEMVDGRRVRSPDDPWMQVMNGAACNFGPAPLFNVWLGVSCERQQEADERIPWLLKTPAAVRFVSAEPLLGPIELYDHWFSEWDHRPSYAYWQEWQRIRGIEPTGKSLLLRPGIDWLIAGGESGSQARPMHPQWARDLRDQCQAAGVPFFFKQWGEWVPWVGRLLSELPLEDAGRHLELMADGTQHRESVGHGGELMARVGKKAAGRLLDGREWNEFPAIVREVEPAHA